MIAQTTEVSFGHKGPLLLIGINLNPIMDK